MSTNWVGWGKIDKKILDNQTVINAHFTRSTDLLEWYDRERPRVKLGGYWWGKEKVKKGRKIMEEGTPHLVKHIEEVRKVIWENVPTMQRTWRREVVGAFPSVPAYLAGVPEDMFNIHYDENEHTPLRIWVGVASSAGVSREQLIKRGAAIAAFAQALSQVRPVYITPYTCGGDRGNNSVTVSWDLQSSPMVMSEVAAAIMEENVMRQFAMDCEYVANPKTNGAWMYGYDDEAYMRKMLGCAEEDLWLNSIHYYDPLLRDPVGWVKSQLKKYSAEEDD